MKARVLVLTLWCPLNSNRSGRDLLGFFPSSLPAGHPCGHGAGIRAHVSASSLKHSQNEDVRLFPGHRYLPAVQSRPVLVPRDQRSLLIQGGYRDLLLGYVSWCVCGVRPGHGQAAILKMEEVEHLTEQFGGFTGGLGVQRGREGQLKLQICGEDNQSHRISHKEDIRKHLQLMIKYEQCHQMNCIKMSFHEFSDTPFKCAIEKCSDIQFFPPFNWSDSPTSDHCANIHKFWLFEQWF